jgi:SAM-dependent methyltransferase
MRSVHSAVRVSYLDICRPVPKTYHNTFDAAVSVNVLEHIEDDTVAIRNMYALLKKGGTIGILVPAKQWAHTELDKKLGHFRRYEKEEISEKMRRAGFRIRHVYFFNFVGIISWMIRDRMRKDADGFTYYQIWLFEHVVPILSFVERYIRAPIGISLVVIAQK